MADPVEAFLNRLHHPALASIDLSLDRMYRLLGMLGSPEKRLPPVIHVAGTNGKGSLLANLQAIFEASGYAVHRYTSPHLVHFRERIILRGQEIDNQRLQTLLKHVASVLPSQPATFFEATTALAFLAFTEKPADILLMETGLGGRLDATNVIAKPALTAITPISFDHCEFLGNSITSIAEEKAGIIKKSVPCVIGRQNDEALKVLERAALRLSAPLYHMGHEWQMEWQGDSAIYRSPKRTLTLRPALSGRHQFDNAATAVACIDQLPQFTISDEQIAQGLANTVWPARLQRLTQHPYNRLVPGGCELWLDGSHNPHGGEVLAQWLKERRLPVYLVCGMVKRKDSVAYLKTLAGLVTELHAVSIPDEPLTLPAEQLQMAARGVGIEAQTAPSVEKALQTIAGHAKTPSIICICGSLYLAGRVLAAQGA